MKVAAMGDLHCRANDRELMKHLFKGVEKDADVLLLAGDLTDNGRVEEAEALAKELKHLSLPVIAVLGNHDHESDKAEEISQILSAVKVCLLDATAYEIDDVGFVGTKGFCGGFEKHLIQPFGERALKTLIQASFDEAVRLENAVAKMRSKHRVALLHYAPIRETVKGESLEIYPFLGSSRLANALDRQGVDVIFHGHSHNGSLEGRTPGNIPVYNVSRFVQSRHGKKAYYVVKVGGKDK